MQIIEVISARHVAGAGEMIDVTAIVDLGMGNEELVHTWAASDHHGLSPLLTDWFAENPEFPIDAAIAPIIAPAPLSLQQVGAARLMVQDWEVTGVEQSQGIAGAFLLDTDLAMVLFAEEFPDTEYIVMPPEGITKHPGYVEVSSPGLSSISFIIMRVQ